MNICSAKDLDKVLELLWTAKDKMAKGIITDDEELTIVVGNLKRAEAMIWTIADDLCDSSEDD